MKKGDNSGKGNGKIRKLSRRVCLKCFASQWVFIFNWLPQRAGRDGEIKRFKSFAAGCLSCSTYHYLSCSHTFIHTFTRARVYTHRHVCNDIPIQNAQGIWNCINLPLKFRILCTHRETSNFKDKIMIVTSLMCVIRGLC